MADARRRLATALTAALMSVLMAGLLSACGSGASSDAEQQMTGTVLDPPFEVNGTPLVDDSETPYSLVQDTDKALTLVFFGYSHCPDICGVVMSTLASAITRLSDEERAKVDVVFVTTDPRRDTPAVAADYATNFHPDFIGLSADLPTIIDVARPLGISVDQGKELPSGGYDVAHGTQVVGIDANDDGIAYWSEDVSSAQLAADIQHLLSDRS